MSGQDISFFRRPGAVSLLLFFVLLAASCSWLGVVPRVVLFSDPLSAEEHALLGAAYERQGKWERAEEEYAAALAKDAGHLPAMVGLANVAFHRGNYRLAVKYYERALEIEPENQVVFNNLALTRLAQGKRKKAREAAERALELDRRDGVLDPRLLDTRAQVRLAEGDRDGAQEDWSQAGALCAALNQEEREAKGCAEIEARREELERQE